MMKVFQAIAALLIGAVLYSCDEDTAGLGWSVVPESDRIDIQADSCIAMSRTIVADDSLTRLQPGKVHRAHGRIV